MSKIENGKSLRVTEEFLRENFSEVLVAAREGRLMIEPKERKMPRREDVIASVRSYVSQIDWLAQPRWAGRVSRVWEAIFDEKDFVDLLMPGPKMRKCRDFNKYSVMRMVGVLRSYGVYDESVNYHTIRNIRDGKGLKKVTERFYLKLFFDLINKEYEQRMASGSDGAVSLLIVMKNILEAELK